MNPFTRLAPLLILVLARPTLAAIFCVGNGDQLVQALVTTRINGQSDEIRLRSGNYLRAGGFAYLPATNENFGIQFSGGWTTSGSNPCGVVAAGSDAFDTMLSSTTASRIMNIEPPAGSSATVTLRRLSFVGGAVVGESGGGLRIAASGNYDGMIVIEQCAFLDNEAGFGSALSVDAPGGVVRLRNSLFTGNNATDPDFSYTARLRTDAAARIYATNNTFVGNTESVSGFRSGAGLLIGLSGQGKAFVANNMLWGNDGDDLRFQSGDDGLVIVRNNNIEDVSGPINEFTDNLSIAPQFPLAAPDFTPAPGSPFVDAGTKPPLIGPIPRPFDQDWSTGTEDVVGHERVSGAQIDIGAFETNYDAIFADGFESPSRPEQDNPFHSW